MSVKKRKKVGSLLFKGFKLTWKMGFLILNAILDIASEKLSKPRPIISAQILHEDDLISDEEYLKSVYSKM